uniref:Nucleolus and neural progenitor protein-like N-terminal domain-containing protein n=1 Tax=Solanum tuberosum TaxID=4113 RepID=M1B3D0_SOLTU
MGSEMEVVEQRLNTFVSQLQTEFAILDRLVYKNKNQHRRCSYFQYLLKVRRDVRLLQTANLEEVLSASFQVLNGKRPKQKVQLLGSLKRRRSNGGKYNFLERLSGVAHLLSQVSLFLLFILLVVQPLIQVCKVTHDNESPVSVYHVSEISC